MIRTVSLITAFIKGHAVQSDSCRYRLCLITVGPSRREVVLDDHRASSDMPTVVATSSYEAISWCSTKALYIQRAIIRRCHCAWLPFQMWTQSYPINVLSCCISVPGNVTHIKAVLPAQGMCSPHRSTRTNITSRGGQCSRLLWCVCCRRSTDSCRLLGMQLCCNQEYVSKRQYLRLQALTLRYGYGISLGYCSVWAMFELQRYLPFLSCGSSYYMSYHIQPKMQAIYWHIILEKQLWIMNLDSVVGNPKRSAINLL